MTRAENTTTTNATRRGRVAATLALTLGFGAVAGPALGAPTPTPSPRERVTGAHAGTAARGATARTKATAASSPAARRAAAARATAAQARARQLRAFAALRPGASGAVVAQLRTNLTRNGFWVPAGRRYDHSTAQAVMALQKVAGLKRTGGMNSSTALALQSGLRAHARSTRGHVIEIDRKRQVLLVVQDGKVTATVNTSTGLVPWMTTPAGRFHVIRQINGWRHAPLGGLYRPKYFYRGYAIHGVPDGQIPGVPASHGCARVSKAAMDMLWGSGGLRLGGQVWVY